MQYHHIGAVSGRSRGVSTISIETPFELAERLTVSLQLEAVKTAAATFIASMRMCIKRGHGCYCAHAHETPLSKPWIRHWQLAPMLTVG